MYRCFLWGGVVQDLLFETIAAQRIGLLAKLAALSDCSGDEKDVIFCWLMELSADLEKKLDAFEVKNPQCGGVSQCRSGFQ